MRFSEHIKRYILHLRLFSENARLFLIGSFFIGIGFSGFYLLFNLYLKELGFGESLIGNILSLTTIGSVVVTIPAALIVRQLEIKKILILSTPLLIVGYFIQATVPIYKYILLAGIFRGAVATFPWVAAAPFFMQNSTPKERPYLFSMNFALILAAGVIGSVVGGYLPEIFVRVNVSMLSGYRWGLVTLLFFVTLAIFPYLLLKKPQQEVQKTAFFKISSSKLLLFKLSFPSLVVGLGAGLSIPFLNLYFKDRFCLPPGTIGILFGCSQFLMVTGVLISPPLAQRYGKIKTVVMTQIISVPFLFILGITHNLYLAIISFLVRAALMNMAQPLVTNFAMEMVKEEDHSITNGLLTIAWTAAWGVSANFGGRLIEKYSYLLPFVITLMLYIFSSLLYFVFFLRTEKK